VRAYAYLDSDVF